MPFTVANASSVLNTNNIGVEGRIPLFSPRGQSVWYDFGYVYTVNTNLTSTSTPFLTNRNGEDIAAMTIISGKGYNNEFLSVSALGDSTLNGFHVGAAGVTSPLPGVKVYGIDVGTIQGRYIYKGRKKNGQERVIYLPRAEIKGNGKGQEQNQDGLQFQVAAVALPDNYTPATALMAAGTLTPFGYYFTVDNWTTQEAALLDAIDADGTAATDVTGLTAVKNGANADLAWTAGTGAKTGYRVDRKIGAAAYTTLATLGNTVTAYSDVAVPAGSVVYRVTTLGVFSDSAGTVSTPALAFP